MNYSNRIEDIISERRREFLPVLEAQSRRGVDPVGFPDWKPLTTRESVEVYLDFLENGRISDEQLRAGLANRLEVEVAYPYLEKIVALYQREAPSSDEPHYLGVKGNLANAIVSHVERHRKELFELILSLVNDEKNGLSRLNILYNFLRTSNDPRAHETIRNLALMSSSSPLQNALRHKQWRSYWLKHDPQLWAEWYPKGNTQKRAS